MKRFKVVGLCLVAMFALSAVTAASASAANLFQIGGSMTFGSANIISGVIDITGGKLTGDGLEITCPSLTILQGLIDESGLVDIKKSFTFTGCKELVKEAKCELSSTTIETKPATGHITSANEIEVTPTESEFVTIEIQNVPGKECTLDGKYIVTGDAVLEVAKAGTEEVEHELVLSKNSKLTVGGNPATITGSGKGKLESGATWSIVS
jgi:hypothetical protein